MGKLVTTAPAVGSLSSIDTSLESLLTGHHHAHRSSNKQNAAASSSTLVDANSMTATAATITTASDTSSSISSLSPFTHLQKQVSTFPPVSRLSYAHNDMTDAIFSHLNHHRSAVTF
jgi:hypothetical protein